MIKDTNEISRPSPKNRSFNLDCLRGFAVILMVIFHFSYDLNIFKFIDINMRSTFWWWFPRIIVFLFLSAVGISNCYSYANGIDKNKLFKRFLKIGGAALIVSVSTYIMFPKTWIYFGTLHCVAVASLLAAPLANRPKLSFLIGSALLSSIYIFDITYKGLSSLFKVKSMDYIPIYPWFFVVAFAIFLFHKGPKIKPLPQNSLFKYMAVLGKHSLRIYILHQPILFGLCFLAHKLLR
ncbi:MAG: putative membrane protein [Thermoproteota archaeon]|jgi:uncharacterized membrane protein